MKLKINEVIENVKDIFDASGAKNYANHLMNKLYDEATEKKVIVTKHV